MSPTAKESRAMEAPSRSGIVECPEATLTVASQTRSTQGRHTVTTGLVFGESPRWHQDRLWFSDMGAREVRVVDLDGHNEVVARVPNGVAGIGFLPDGRLLIVAMRDGFLLRRERDGALVTYADLTGLSRKP